MDKQRDDEEEEGNNDNFDDDDEVRYNFTTAKRQFGECDDEVREVAGTLYCWCDIQHQYEVVF